MHIAAFHGDLPILKYFKKRGANIQALKDNDGRTPLHLAATFNTVDVVKQLVQWGAVVDARAEVRCAIKQAQPHVGHVSDAYCPLVSIVCRPGGHLF